MNGTLRALHVTPCCAGPNPAIFAPVHCRTLTGMNLHASCAARGDQGVLFLAPPGGGKSDLLLRLLDRGWALVADDQVALRPAGAGLLAAPPEPLAGLLEVRGLGLLERLPWREAPLVLAISLTPAAGIPRLPEPARWTALGRHLPLLALDPAPPSAPLRLERALDVLAGRAALRAGAFAA